MAKETLALATKACSSLAEVLKNCETTRVVFNDKNVYKENGRFYIPDVSITIGSTTIRGKLTLGDRDTSVSTIAFHTITTAASPEEADKWYEWAKELIKDNYYLEELDLMRNRIYADAAGLAEYFCPKCQCGEWIQIDGDKFKCANCSHAINAAEVRIA
jgi:hypothetical protein